MARESYLPRNRDLHGANRAQFSRGSRMRRRQAGALQPVDAIGTSQECGRCRRLDADLRENQRVPSLRRVLND